MKALWVDGGGLRLRNDLPVPRPAAGEALIRLRLAGICSTDLEIVRGYGDFAGVPGHEFVGDVIESAETEWLGKRVVGSINVGCGECDFCLMTGPEHCLARNVLGIAGRNGAFAEYLTLPCANLHEVPDEVDDEQAVFTEPLAAALRIGQQLPLLDGDQVAVLGPGRLGTLIAQALQAGGADVQVLGRNADSLELVARLGLKTAIAADQEAGQFRLVIEATGNDEGFAEALRLVRSLGIIVLKSTYFGRPHFDLTKVVVDEITVIGSRCGPFQPALQMLEQHQVEVIPLIDGRFSLDQGLEAFRVADQPGVRKILLSVEPQ